MEVKIENGKLIISIDMQAPTSSATGKTLVVATTHGNVTTDCVIDGKPVVVGLNSYIKKQIFNNCLKILNRKLTSIIFQFSVAAERYTLGSRRGKPGRDSATKTLNSLLRRRLARVQMISHRYYLFAKFFLPIFYQDTARTLNKHHPKARQTLSKHQPKLAKSYTLYKHFVRHLTD